MKRQAYQHPELRDENDNIIQEGTYGKESPLVNGDNTGVLDYINNNLEALYDTIGDSAATLDDNGHVVEPANLAIGDEDGNRLKTSYLRLSGGTINGDLSFTGGNRRINFSNGKSLLVSYGNGVYVYGDTADKSSSFIAFTNENGGGFQVNAGDGTTQRRMVGKPDGTLTWDNKNVERVNSSGTNYIRYESGLQLCWGRVSINVNSTTNTTPFEYRGVVTVTFPVAFRGTPFGVSNVDDSSPWWTTTARSITSTTMQVEASGNAQATKVVCWFAVGR